MSWGISPSMVKASPSKGGFYGITDVNNQGEALSGYNNYRLHLPADVPAAIKRPAFFRGETISLDAPASLRRPRA